jgi:MFS family permease
MNLQTPAAAVHVQQPTRVRHGVLGLACSLSMITYLDRVCFGSVIGYIKNEFNLTDTERGLLFGAFSLSYAVFEVPSGWLGDVFGPRKTLIRIVLWWSLFTALTGLIWPVPAWGALPFLALLAVRFCFGLGEAGAYPNIARAFHNWFPVTERGFAQGTVWMAGRLMGGATPLIVFALIFTTEEAGIKTVHWRHAFWIFGMLGVVWCAVFYWWFRDLPHDKPGVNAAELALITAGRQTGDVHSHAGVPWRRLLTSGNLWILCLMYFCASYGWYFNITYLPDYLNKVYKFNRDEAGLLVAGLVTGSPLLAGAVACLAGGILSDLFIRRTGNRKWGRRLFGVVGHGVCALCYFGSMFAPNVYMFMLAIAMAAFWNDLTMGAAWASCLDIGRKYSGIVSGSMNTIGNLGGFLAGVATGMVLDAFRDPLAHGATAVLGPAGGAVVFHDPHVTAWAWNINFILFTGVYVLAAVCWLLFDSTKPLVHED